eukprot:TRINITY_DN6698_c0_g2_i1.p1 TRINITY_DN6698_c0_g2~~TRINITY_DN6698_c0_g2_i1.p1  ORF type:complete len:1917 (+),score=320.51 TRINITY_DN6698_c0_g2_i1:103-5751(+)
MAGTGQFLKAGAVPVSYTACEGVATAMYLGGAPLYIEAGPIPAGMAWLRDAWREAGADDLLGAVGLAVDASRDMLAVEGLVFLDAATVLVPAQSLATVAAKIAGADCILRTDVYFKIDVRELEPVAGLRPPLVTRGGDEVSTLPGSLPQVLTTSAGDAVLKATNALEDGTQVALDETGRPVVYLGRALPIDSSTRHVLWHEHGRPTPLRIAGRAVIATRNCAMRVGEDSVVAGPGGDTLRLAKTLSIAGSDPYACDTAVVVSVDDRGVWHAADGRRLHVTESEAGPRPVTARGQLVVADGPLLTLYDGTAVLGGCVWPNGEPMAAAGPAAPHLATQDGRQAVLGPDGEPVVLRRGQAYTASTGAALVVVPRPDDVLVLEPSPSHPALFTDNMGRLRDAGGEKVACGDDGAPLLAVDGTLMHRAGSDATMPLYVRKDGQGRAVLHHRLAPSDAPVLPPPMPRSNAAGSAGLDALVEPVRCGEGGVGAVATTPDSRLRRPDGTVLDGVTVLPSGVAVESVTRRPVRVAVLPGGAWRVVVWDDGGSTWTEVGSERQGAPCTPWAERLALHPVTQAPLRTSDGRWVVEREDARSVDVLARQRFGLARCSGARCATTAVVATHCDGAVMLWDDGTAMVSTADTARHLLSPAGAPVQHVVVHTGGGLVHTQRHGEVVVVARGAGVLVLTRRNGGVYEDEAGVARVADGREIVLSPLHLPYKGTGHQLVVRTELADGASVVTLEDKTPVALDPDTGAPVTWANGKVVTRASGVDVDAAGVMWCTDGAVARRVRVVPGDHIVLETGHPRVWERRDGEGLVLADGRLVEEEDGVPVTAGGRCLLRDSRRLEDGVRVAYAERPGTAALAPILWNGDPAAPAVAGGDDGATLLPPETAGSGAEAGFPAPGGGYVKVAHDGRCVTAAGDAVTLVQGDDRAPHRALVAKTDAGGRRVAVGGVQLYVDAEGRERVDTGEAVAAVAAAEDAGSVLVVATKDGTLSVLAQPLSLGPVIRNRHSPDAPFVLPNGAVLLWGGDAMRPSIPSALPVLDKLRSDAAGFPIDAAGDAVVLAVLNRDGRPDVVALRPAADPMMHGLFIPACEGVQGVYLRSGEEVYVGATGWPVRGLCGSYVVCEAGATVASRRRYRFADGGVVAVGPDGSPVVISGLAAGRDERGHLVLPRETAHAVERAVYYETEVDASGAVFHVHGRRQRAMVVPCGARPLLLVPCEEEARQPVGVWVEPATGRLFTAGGEALTRDPTTQELLLRYSAPSPMRYRTLFGERVAVCADTEAPLGWKRAGKVVRVNEEGVVLAPHPPHNPVRCWEGAVRINAHGAPCSARGVRVVLAEAADGSVQGLLPAPLRAEQGQSDAPLVFMDAAGELCGPNGDALPALYVAPDSSATPCGSVVGVGDEVQPSEDRSPRDAQSGRAAVLQEERPARVASVVSNPTSVMSFPSGDLGVDADVEVVGVLEEQPRAYPSSSSCGRASAGKGRGVASVPPSSNPEETCVRPPLRSGAGGAAGREGFPPDAPTAHTQPSHVDIVPYRQCSSGTDGLGLNTSAASGASVCSAHSAAGVCLRMRAVTTPHPPPPSNVTDLATQPSPVSMLLSQSPDMVAGQQGLARRAVAADLQLLPLPERQLMRVGQPLAVQAPSAGSSVASDPRDTPKDTPLDPLSVHSSVSSSREIQAAAAVLGWDDTVEPAPCRKPSEAPLLPSPHTHPAGRVGTPTNAPAVLNVPPAAAEAQTEWVPTDGASGQWGRPPRPSAALQQGARAPTVGQGPQGTVLHGQLNHELHRRMAADHDARIGQQLAALRDEGDADHTLLQLSLSPIHHSVRTPQGEADGAPSAPLQSHSTAPPPAPHHSAFTTSSAGDASEDSTITVVAEPCYTLDEFE